MDDGFIFGIHDRLPLDFINLLKSPKASKKLVGHVGIEPTTYGLRDRGAVNSPNIATKL